MAKTPESMAIAQRRWRNGVIKRLKFQLGLWCRGCEYPEDSRPNAAEKELSLVVHNRRSPEYRKFGNNTISIYSQILQGKLPLDKVTLLCDDCKFLGRGSY